MSNPLAQESNEHSGFEEISLFANAFVALEV